MTDFAMQDGRVKEQTLTDKEKAVYEEFSVIDGNDDTSWHKYLSVNKHGDVENSIQKPHDNTSERFETKRE